MVPLLFALALGQPADKPFVVTVVDEQTGRGVPLIELKTVHGVAYHTDSAGVAAISEPGLSGEDVYFAVSGHGYEFPKDGFGFRGKALRVTPGGSAKLAVKRLNVAERLYRVTGGGIYRDSVLAGLPVPVKQSVLNAKVLGQDSVQSTAYRGKLWWFYGDTLRPSYPLGNFHMPGATTPRPGADGFDPDRGVDLAYFADKTGFAKETCRMPGTGPTWMSGLVALPGADGQERLCAAFVKIEPPLKVYGRGLCLWDDAREEFVHKLDVPLAAPVFPDGHTFVRNGFAYFANPFPLVRVKASAADYFRPEAYEAFTCLKPGTTLADAQIDRDGAGKPRYEWRAGTPAVFPADELKLIAAGRLKKSEARWQLADAATGKVVQPHNGSVAWNTFRKRWVLIAVELNGSSSHLGEVWYAEADAPTGPWGPAVKVVTHDRYSFYNPRHHPLMDRDGGRVIYFEGTYTHTFSGNPVPTPRYEYNQVMYRLDLADPRLAAATRLPPAAAAP